jgi:hypothetical protein
MAQTGIVIGKESWGILQEEPLYSARFIDREGTDELAVVVRVEELEWFLGIYPPLTLDLTTWSSALGTWVVAVSYQLHPVYGGTTGGTFFLNPRQAADTEILRKLQQGTFALVLLSEDCNTHYTANITVDPRDILRWRQLLDDMNQALAGERLTGDLDADFEAALQEFQSSKVEL